jgi:hypothetical protein
MGGAKQRNPGVRCTESASLCSGRQPESMWVKSVGVAITAQVCFAPSFGRQDSPRFLRAMSIGGEELAMVGMGQKPDLARKVDFSCKAGGLGAQPPQG